MNMVDEILCESATLTSPLVRYHDDEAHGIR
jgi:hypothetical protein